MSKTLRGRFLAGGLWLFLSGLAHSATFTGTVFEDANYGGGAGRSRTTAAGVGIPNVTVEFYLTTGTGTYVNSVVTDANGFFTFNNVGSANALRVRVVNGTARSMRTNGLACLGTCVPVQTFRTDASTGTAVDVTNRVGGESPALSDAYVRQAGNSFNALTAGSRTPQSYTVATPAGTGSTIANIDFGFNFDVIVAKRDPTTTCTPTNSSFPCQGTLRQFVINANNLGGEVSLVQSGSGQIDGSTTFLPAGYESSIFMIPDGTANPGQNTTTGYASQLVAGVAEIALAGALDTVAGPNTRLDATT